MGKANPWAAVLVTMGPTIRHLFASKVAHPVPDHGTEASQGQHVARVCSPVRKLYDPLLRRLHATGVAPADR
jgi:hypothetical protein